jgi:hypothetical protein
MENLSEVPGYVGSTLVLFTFVGKDMHVLRIAAIFSNLAFITYGTTYVFLHLMLLSLNIIQLREIVRATQAAGDLTQAEGAVRAQTLCAGMTARGQSPAAPWPIFLSTPRTAHPA